MKTLWPTHLPTLVFASVFSALAMPAAAQSGNSEPPASAPASLLTDQQQKVSQIATQNGDPLFIMVDKTHGKILLFNNGEPVLTANALTGLSMADVIPRSDFAKTFNQISKDDKITPAGRYMVRIGFDPAYGGTIFDVNGIRGKDWGLAIHKVWLGIPPEHRDLRLKSSSDNDKNISYGCINVAKETLAALLGLVKKYSPGHTVQAPLYILPRDESKTASFFPLHQQVVEAPKVVAEPVEPTAKPAKMITQAVKIFAKAHRPTSHRPIATPQPEFEGTGLY